VYEDIPVYQYEISIYGKKLILIEVFLKMQHYKSTTLFLGSTTKYFTVTTEQNVGASTVL